MDKPPPIDLQKLRIAATLVISLLILVFLLWAYFHGGVPSHHLLDQKDLPAISNWWSGIWLPILSWVLLGKIKTRLEKLKMPDKENESDWRWVLGRFGIGLTLGILLSVSFSYHFAPFLDNLLYLLLILAFFIPLFFSEFILGFVLGMTYTFGAILPTGFIGIIAAMGFLIYTMVRPFLWKLTRTRKN